MIFSAELAIKYWLGTAYTFLSSKDLGSRRGPGTMLSKGLQLAELSLAIDFPPAVIIMYVTLKLHVEKSSKPHMHVPER